jgi:hypothetical protein
MISAHACGMPALAVPGDQAWDRAWVLGFEDRDVTIVMHADRPAAWQHYRHHVKPSIDAHVGAMESLFGYVLVKGWRRWESNPRTSCMPCKRSTN